MTVHLVGAGPGDPGLLTRRGAELLARADVVVHDRLVDPAVLALAAPGAELIDVGKRPGSRGAADQEAINALLVELGGRHPTVVRLKGGDPFVLGRGGEEAQALARAGVPWEVVPGVTSAVAVPAAAGIPVTHRGVATSVTVATGRVGNAPGVDWEALARVEGTLVVLMGAAGRAAMADRLMAGGRPGDTPVAVVERGTTSAQRVARTTLAELGRLPVQAPAVLVVGPVAAMALTGGPERPLSGSVVVVTRPRDQGTALVGALDRAGAVVLEVPAIAVADPPDGGTALRRAAAAVARYQWVAFTSANAVRRFVPLLRDGRTLAGVRLAAVGAATAGALAGFHLAADLVPDRATAAALARALPPSPPGGRVLFPRAEGAGEDLVRGLGAQGWEVDEVVAYRTEPCPPPPPPVLEAVGAAGAVVLASPSAVDAVTSWGGPGGAPVVVPPLVACIGPATAARARQIGLDGVVEAPSPRPEDMVAVLARHLGPAASPGGGPAASPGGGPGGAS